MINNIDFAQGGWKSNMKHKKEKRTDRRFACNVAIIFSHFSTRNWVENRSVTLNLSTGGMCFKSRHSFKPHAILYIRIGQNPETISNISNWNLLHMSTLAEVRWCQEIAREDGARYTMGVKYL
jgi:hypothetical protein